MYNYKDEDYKVLYNFMYYKKLNNGEYLIIFPDIPYYGYCNKSFFEKLKQNPDFFENFFSKIKKKRIDIRKKMLQRGLGAVQIKITDFCNLRCIYCFENCMNKKHLSVKEFDKVLNNLREFNLERIVLTGGEVLLHPNLEELLDKVVEYFGDIEIRIQTNGTLEDKIEIFKKYTDYNFTFQVSIDHHTKEIHERLRGKNTFDKVVKTIKTLKDMNYYVIAYSTLNRLNVQNFDEFMVFLSELNIDRYGFSILRSQGAGKYCQNIMLSDEEIFDFCVYLLDLIKKYPFISSLNDFIKTSLGYFVRDSCGAGVYTVSVDCNLNVFPCQICTDDRLKMGNLNDSSLKEIYENSRISKLLKEYCVDNITSCKNCLFKYFCGGGCLAEKFRIYGTLDAPCIRCNIIKNVFKYLIENRKILEFCKNN